VRPARWETEGPEREEEEEVKERERDVEEVGERRM